MGLDFSALHLVIGEKSPSADILRSVFSVADDKYSENDTHYLITKENLDDKYFWIYARYGKSVPYSSTVYNTKVQKEEENPRNNDQIEPDKQLFGLYCVNSLTLYFSSTQKKSWLEEYLKARLSKDVVIKAFFKNVEEFIKQIKTVEKVKFVAKRNLFNSEGEIMKIFPSPNDLYGLGMPEDFTLEAKFSNASVTDDFVNCLKRMVGWKNSCEADSLLCIGRDEKNFETVFNAESFIQKINIEPGKDDRGMYDPSTVKNMLLKRIGGKDEANS